MPISAVEQSDSVIHISVQFSRSVVSDSLRRCGLQHTRPPCPSPTPEVYSNSCPLSRWCHPTISSSVVPFSSCLQSFPVSGSFPVSRIFVSGGQSIGASASASVLLMNIQDWFPLGLTGLTKRGPLQKGMANHFSILALRTPWTVWKGKLQTPPEIDNTLKIDEVYFPEPLSKFACHLPTPPIGFFIS